MIFEENELTPIKLFGACCLFFGFILLIGIAETERQEFQIFLLANAAFHLLTGMGIFFRTSWGFKLMVFYLHILKFGYPIFTALARYFFEHIEEHRIKKYFGKNAIKL